jgi:hypothetical protein
MSISVPRSRKQQSRGSKLRLDAVELRAAVAELLREEPGLTEAQLADRLREPPRRIATALRALAPARPRRLTIDGLALLMTAAEAREERSTVATLALAGGVPEQVVAELLDLALAALLVRQVGETWEIARRGRMESPWALSAARVKSTRAAS